MIAAEVSPAGVGARPGQPGTRSLATRHPAGPDRVITRSAAQFPDSGSWSHLPSSEHTLCVLGPSFRAVNKLLGRFAPKMN